MAVVVDVVDVVDVMGGVIVIEWEQKEAAWC